MLCDIKKSEPREKLVPSDDQGDNEENEKGQKPEESKKEQKIFLNHHPEPNEQLYPLINKQDDEKSDIQLYPSLNSNENENPNSYTQDDLLSSTKQKKKDKSTPKFSEIKATDSNPWHQKKIEATQPKLSANALFLKERIGPRQSPLMNSSSAFKSNHR